MIRTGLRNNSLFLFGGPFSVLFFFPFFLELVTNKPRSELNRQKATVSLKLAWFTGLSNTNALHLTSH